MSRVSIVLPLALALLAPSAARAEAPVQSFRPSASATSHVATETSQVLPKWTPSAGLLLTWDHALLRRTPGAIAIDRRLTSNVLFAFGIAGWAEIGLHLPLVMHQRATVLEQGVPVDAAPQGIGDLRIGGKGTILRTPRRGFGLGLAFDVTAPTGNAKALTGAGAPTYAPQLLFEHRGARAILTSVNVGWMARNEVDLGGVRVGDAFTYRAAVRIPLSAREQVAMFGEIDGAASVVRGAMHPLSVRGGFRFVTRGGMIMNLWAGGAPMPALGVPELQAGLTIAFAPPKWMRSDRAFDGSDRPSAVEVARHYDARLGAEAKVTSEKKSDPADPDRDGIAEDDACPNVPEDADDVEDADGCPELDDDRDGLRDGVDLCSGAPEIVNGYLDWDGCPDRNDGDGRGETFASFEARRVLPAIAFADGTAELDDAAEAKLGELAELLRLNPWIERVQLRVFVMATRDAAKDQALATARAGAIAEGLVAEGIDRKRVEVLPGRTVNDQALARGRITIGATPAVSVEAQGPSGGAGGSGASGHGHGHGHGAP